MTRKAQEEPLIAHALSAYRLKGVCLSLVGRLLIARDLLAYVSFGSAQRSELLCLQLEKLPLIAEHALEMVSFC